jgi:hypothetical protein
MENSDLSKRILQRIEEASKKTQEGEYGGKGEFKLPQNHIAGIKVPKGGSCCANCKFLGEDKKSCGNKYWIEWNGGNSKLPAPADEYCSDWFESKKHK